MKNITLRAPEPDDVDRLYQWENDPEGGLHGHWAHAPLSRFQIWEYVDSYDANPAGRGEVRMMIEVDGNVAGTIDLYDLDMYNRRASVGIYIGKEYRSQGLGVASIEKITAYATESIGLNTLQAYCLKCNTAGITAFEKAGFNKTGELPAYARIGKQYFNVVIFSKIL